MELLIDIKTYLKKTFKLGFKIIESKNLGMAKYCLLEHPNFNIEIWNDRFDYDAIIEHSNNKLNLIHLANFINDKQTKYHFFDEFETRINNSKKFLTQLDKIIDIEFDNILDFLYNLTNEKQTEFDKYCEKINFDITGL